MDGIICFIIAIAMIVFSAAAAFRYRHAHQGKKHFLTSLQILFAGVFCSAFFCLLPIYAQVYLETSGSILKTITSSLHTTFQVFTIDVDSEDILKSVSIESETFRSFYTAYLSILFVLTYL